MSSRKLAHIIPVLAYRSNVSSLNLAGGVEKEVFAAHLLDWSSAICHGCMCCDKTRQGDIKSNYRVFIINNKMSQ